MGTYRKRKLAKRKNVALVAHDKKKGDLLEWAEYNKETLRQHTLHATGTTAIVLSKKLDLSICRFQSGPLGGDLQIGADITEEKLDVLIFFWDPLEAQPHDPDVKALLRIAAVWNIPVACNRASADFILSSPLMCDEYDCLIPDYKEYEYRLLPGTE